MDLDRAAVCFGMSEIGCASRRSLRARLAVVSAVLGRTAFTESACHSPANPTFHPKTSKRNVEQKRRRRWSVMVVAVVVLLPLVAVAGSKPFVWPGGTRITVRDYTSEAYAPIVKAEVAAWSRLMPGGTTLAYSRPGFKDCSDFGGLKTQDVPVNQIWICSTATVGGQDLWGQGFVYALNDRIVSGYAKVEERGPKTSHERYGLVCHELGHTLGLRHMKGRETCMGATRVKRDFPGKKDKATLEKRYAAAGSP